MPRHKQLDRPVEWSLRLPSSLADEVELLLIDPLRGKPAFGARSALVVSLLREWIDKRRPNGDLP
jgi:hypothetical protein